MLAATGSTPALPEQSYSALISHHLLVALICVSRGGGTITAWVNAQCYVPTDHLSRICLFLGTVFDGLAFTIQKANLTCAVTIRTLCMICKFSTKLFNWIGGSSNHLRLFYNKKKEGLIDWTCIISWVMGAFHW